MQASPAAMAAPGDTIRPCVVPGWQTTKWLSCMAVRLACAADVRPKGLLAR